VEPSLGGDCSTCPDDGDHQRVADVLNASFGRDWHTAKEIVNFIKLSPSCRHDLNLVAEASDDHSQR